MARVLIVDDSDAHLRLMRYELEKSGYEVSTARSGVEALALAEKERPDLVLLDVLMPEMDGFETCRRLKADAGLKPIPVLMWTSLDNTDDVVRGLEVGAQDYVTKPFVTEVLQARIRTALRGKEARDELVETNRKLVDSQKAAEHALNVRNEFLSHVSHELRTPLTTVHQFLSILLDGLGGELSDDQKEYLEICMRSAKQLRSMISDLMDVTRTQNGKLRVSPRPIDLAAVLQQVVRTQEAPASAKGITLESNIELLPEVLGDHTRVRQVVSNLIDNALKFTPEGGTISLHAQRDVDDPSFVRVEVRDTGCGISQEAQDRIFQYMQQEGDNDWRSRNGLGIGLFICRELVTRQAGRIWVESEPEKGSSFLFTLPVFDFVKLVEPALVEEGSLRDEVALVRVDLRSSRGSSGRGIAEALIRRGYHLAQSSLYPHDVLLPRFFSSTMQETFFIIAASDEAGMNSLLGRLRERLCGEDMQADDLQIDVSGLLKRFSDETRGMPSEEGLKYAAQEIHLLTQIDSDWSE